MLSAGNRSIVTGAGRARWTYRRTRMRRWVGLLAVVGVATAGAGSGPAAASGVCVVPKGVTCTDVNVPLDRTGTVPGRVTVRFVRLAASGPSRGTVVYLA